MNRYLMIMVLTAAMLIGGCAPGKVLPDAQKLPAGSHTAQSGAAGTSSSPIPSSQKQVTVYYATSDAEYLMAEKRVIANDGQPAKAATELLFTEPLNKRLMRVMPEGVRLKNIFIKDNIAYADFNDKLSKNIGAGSTTERLVINSIVNTLTEFPEINQVQILIEGRKVDTLSGHMDLSAPLKRSEGIIKH